LEKELNPAAKVADETVSYWANRKLLPGFKEYWESDGIDGGPDSTRIISEGRDDR
jgi:hypothetical protein